MTDRRFILLCGLAGVVVASAVLPVWTVWYIGPREATPEMGFLWQSLAMIPENAREVGARQAIFGYQLQNLVPAVIVFTLGLGAGRAILDLRQRRRHLRQTRGLCPACGYWLRGNVSGVCPECGTPVGKGG